MNIYVTDKSPVRAACNLDDPMIAIQLHFVMQVLSTVVEADAKGIWVCQTVDLNNPFVRWARNSADNRNWLILHAYGLCDEYEYRFRRKHTMEATLNKIMAEYTYHQANVWAFLNRSSASDLIPDPIQAYRYDLTVRWNTYYRNRDLRWTNVEVPDWYHSGVMKRKQYANSLS